MTSLLLLVSLCHACLYFCFRFSVFMFIGLLIYSHLVFNCRTLCGRSLVYGMNLNVIRFYSSRKDGLYVQIQQVLPSSLCMHNFIFLFQITQKQCLTLAKKGKIHYTIRKVRRWENVCTTSNS